MVLNEYRGRVDPLLTKIARPFTRFHPNTLTYLSLLFAILGGFLYYLDFLIFSFLSIFLSAIFDALDGKVARIRKLSSKRGDFLDHLFDRYADAAIIIGIGLSRYSSPQIAIFALTGVFLTSYVGTQAQAVGLERLYAGFLGRAERMIILTILPLLQYFVSIKIIYFTVTEWVLLIFAVLGILNSIYRAVVVWKKLK